ncbi:MAG TPA: sugar ABC transporter permease [Firmicutes bacterium]|jgi:raffinose/stachyose/melibiose transport system permease protein|nr:sugar ABC transporter permease [Bacillota bacterium]
MKASILSIFKRTPKENPGAIRKRSYSSIALEILMGILAIIFLSPTILIFINSFKSDAQITLNPLALPDSINFANYINAWHETNFPVVFTNTLIITSLSMVGIIIVSAMAAYILARTPSRISWIFYLIFTFSLVVPFQTFMIPLVKTAKDFNLQNVLGIIPIYIGLGCPMAVFMYHGFIKSVPIEIDESAAIDGSSQLRTFFHLVFPLLTPVTATIAILDALWIWNDFLLPLIILPKQATLQLAQFGFFSLYRRQYSLAMASLVLSAAPIVIFYLALQKYIVKGVAAGAVKG